MKNNRNESTLYNLIRSVNNDKDWIDAYNTQINRILVRNSINELTYRQKRVLYMLVNKCTIAYLNYILKKHC